MTTTAELQRRTLRVLVGAQVLSGAGLAAGITVGALLAQDMLGSTSLAGLPSALFTAGSALAAVGVGRISQSHGRRPGLATGYAVGALGSAGVVLAAVLDSPVLLFVTLFVYGAGSATNLQARYAGADLADAGHRARAISTVLVATTLGGVVGPLLAATDRPPGPHGRRTRAGRAVPPGHRRVRRRGGRPRDEAAPRPAPARARAGGGRGGRSGRGARSGAASGRCRGRPRHPPRRPRDGADPDRDGRDHDDDPGAHARPRTRHRGRRHGDRGARRRDVPALAPHRPTGRPGRPHHDGGGVRCHPAGRRAARRLRARRLRGPARPRAGPARPRLELRPDLGLRHHHRRRSARDPGAHPGPGRRVDRDRRRGRRSGVGHRGRRRRLLDALAPGRWPARPRARRSSIAR